LSGIKATPGDLAAHFELAALPHRVWDEIVPAPLRVRSDCDSFLVCISNAMEPIKIIFLFNFGTIQSVFWILIKRSRSYKYDFHGEGSFAREQLHNNTFDCFLTCGLEITSKMRYTLLAIIKK
jgi:hypothetical protein